MTLFIDSGTNWFVVSTFNDIKYTIELKIPGECHRRRIWFNQTQFGNWLKSFNPDLI